MKYKVNNFSINDKETSRVLWGNSDQNFEISFCFCSFSVILHCILMIFLSLLVQSVLYRFAKESPKNIILVKSISQNGESSVELIRITPHGVIQITL
jgi:hypothetical protein